MPRCCTIDHFDYDSFHLFKTSNTFSCQIHGGYLHGMFLSREMSLFIVKYAMGIYMEHLIHMKCLNTNPSIRK